jgi:hypothetical protein
VRERATSSEWVAYYQRAEEFRAVIGDPFQRLVERGHRRGRYSRIALMALAILVAAVVVVGALWLFDNVSWRDLLSDGSV